MLDNSSHIRTLHNLIITFVMIFLVATIGDYIKQPSKFRDEYETFLWNIADFGRFIQIWLIMNLSVICLHYPLVLLNNFYQYRWLINNPEKDLDRLFEMYQKQKYSGWLQQTFLYIAYALISFFGIFFYCTNRLIVLDIKITGSFAALMEMVSFFLAIDNFHIFVSYTVTIFDEISFIFYREKRFTNRKRRTGQIDCTKTTKAYHSIILVTIIESKISKFNLLSIFAYTDIFRPLSTNRQNSLVTCFEFWISIHCGLFNVISNKLSICCKSFKNWY